VESTETKLSQIQASDSIFQDIRSVDIASNCLTVNLGTVSLNSTVISLHLASS